jgi:DNA-binding LacI/PurR family transcriptional regulator
MKKRTSPNIIDVARRAGVSPATVSRVLSKKDLVRTETKTRVLAAMDELNYEPDSYGNRRQRKTGTIAVVIPELTDQFFSILIKGIGDEGRLHGYSFLLYNTENSPDIERGVLEIALDKEIDGIVIVPSDDDPGLAELFEERRIPYVFLDRLVSKEDIPSVVSDDEEGAYQGTKYLLDLGHRDILYIGGETRLSTERNRLKGFTRALADHDLSLSTQLVRECSFHYEEGYEETLAILEKGYPFTAVFAASDLIAFGAKAAIEKHGLSVPDNISLVGYGDIPSSRFMSLTTVSNPAYEMGKSAFRLLLDYIENRIATPKQIVLRPSVVFRSTCIRKRSSH